MGLEVGLGVGGFGEGGGAWGVGLGLGGTLHAVAGVGVHAFWEMLILFHIISKLVKDKHYKVEY